MMRSLVLVIALVCVGAAPVAAQTAVSSTSGILFTASPDHFATNEDGSQRLDHYEANIVSPTGLFWTQSIGKPAPNMNNDVLVKPLSGFAGLILGVSYTYTVSSVGPGGTSTSSPSGPFVKEAAAPVTPRNASNLRLVP